MRWGVSLALAMAGGQVMAASGPASEAQVRQLMDVVGVGKMLSQMNYQAVTTMQQSLPCVPAEYWQNYMDANATQQFIGRLVPVYQKHFNAEELEGLLKFYRSPLGQKVINEMPTTMAEANQAGRQWSQERSDQMIAELKQKGSLDASGRCPSKVAAAAPALGAVTAQADDEAEEAPAKPAAKAPAKSKAKAPAKKAPAKSAAKKPATKTPAKTDAKSSASSDAKAAPSKAASPTPPAQGGQ
ncbi:DUF2059 domain-containing protein [Dyella jiangningensis]|uniref:DUF2059 domain-containing protein n=1 Tax=Dyella jiangningensis TaxID=1379159 RepID=UPI002410631A|nr:DUF2059 domain-containing protein [Dyella jiangningensis]MDG2537539.1 DUF2059 domain-containing protein [Dyella jiangningensis]